MRMANRSIDILEIESALACIPADERETWIRVGMAIRSGLGDAGFDIWDCWSQKSSSYREQDARNVWKSFTDGSVSIGTLFYHARLHGWNGGQHRRIETPRGPEERSTAAYALELWLNARRRRSDADIASHPYAKTKGIESAGGAGRGKAIGRIIGKSDCIIVPIYSIETGKPQGVQCINPEGVKQTFGNVTAGGLLLGNTVNRKIPWYICEGWASAYSMVFHHLSGNAMAAASFGKSNMDRLAKSIADKYQPNEITILREVDR